MLSRRGVEGVGDVCEIKNNGAMASISVLYAAVVRNDDPVRPLLSPQTPTRGALHHIIHGSVRGPGSGVVASGGAVAHEGG